MNNEKKLILVGIVLALVHFFFCCDLPFFWDHIALTSKFANHFYENGVFPPIVPEDIDHGHPPFFAVYLSGIWQALGRTLFVSHLAMLPFVIALIVQWIKLAKFFIPSKYLWLALIVLIAEPTLLAQSTMVGTEIPLALGVVMVLNGIVYKNNFFKACGLLLCGLVSIRGSMWCIALFLTDFALLLSLGKKQFKNFVTLLLPYIIVGSIVIAWFGFHYYYTGYLLVGEQSAWAGNHVWNFSLSSLIYNGKILAWAIGDFGRVVLYLGLIVLLLGFIFKSANRNTFFTDKNKCLPLIYFLISSALIYFPIMIFRSGNTLRRYLIPFYLISLLLFLVLAFQLSNKKISYTIIGITIITLFAGHLIIYPERYSQDWDSSLAHLPYFELDEKMKTFIKSENIWQGDIATGFPTYNSQYNTYLETDKEMMVPIRTKKVIRKELVIEKYTNYYYVLISNIHNRLQPHELKELRTSPKWKSIKKLNRMGVYIELFKNQQP